MNKLNLVNQRFGRWLVLSQSGKTKHGNLMWECKCECGTIAKLAGGSLRSGLSVSCGCYKIEQTVKYQTKHGLSKSPLYSCWTGLVDRCTNPKNKKYADYGQRGIRVCNEWFQDFMVFYRWAIANDWQTGLQIDRSNNDGNYEPNNCRFVSNRENSLNQRVLIKGNKTGFAGVSKDKTRNKFFSEIQVRGAKHKLGRYSSRIKAVLARDFYIIENNLQNEYKVQVSA